MARKSDFMRWIDHQIKTDAGLKLKVEQHVNGMMIEYKVGARRSQPRHDTGETRPVIRA